ncbi:MAG: hypothetical protein KIT39_17250 [Nitrospirales bacterium]|nr:hypothetical protein [Nitrospirales bacterium]
MRLVEPVPQNSTRSALADWLELSALTSNRRQVSESSLIGLHNLYGGESDTSSDPEPETGDVLDESILDSVQEQFVQAVVEEILYRDRVLHGHYPFVVKPRGVLLAHPKNEEQLTTGEWVYLFCLLCSAIREDGLQAESAALTKRIPALFQMCSCLAAAGYLSGSVSSFGFPRAEGNAFLPALRLAYKNFGEGTVRSDSDVPPGSPSQLKDGGIDVIAWKDFPDRLPGKLYLLGQCASGKNWRGKTVKTYVAPLHGNWFVGHPPSDPINAMFIPFTFHHELQDREDVDFLSLLRTTFHSETFTFGVIHDRLRIAYFAEIGSGLPQCQEVDMQENISLIQNWVREVLNAVRES